MIGLQRLKNDLAETIKQLEKRGGSFAFLKETALLYQERNHITNEVENLQNSKNIKSKTIAQLKKAQKPTKDLLEQINQISHQITTLKEKKEKLERKITDVLITVPNVPRETVPQGKDESDNLEIRK